MDRNRLKETWVKHQDGKLLMNIYWNQRDLPCYWHDEYEFIYAATGTFECIINGEKEILQTGELALVQGGQLHSVNVLSPGEYISVVIHPLVCGHECADYLYAHLRFRQLFRPENPLDRHIIENIRQVIEVFQKKEFAYEFRIKSVIMDLFATLFEQEQFDQEARQPADQAFQRLIEYVQENYFRSISLDDLTACSNYSKSQVIKLFKKHTGKSPIEYINTYRVFKARNQLINTADPIIDVAASCGFENIGHFIRLFKRHTGMTPGKWRRNGEELIT